MTDLYLVRHGETVDNANKIMQGQTQGELNANGIEQARTVAKNLAVEQFDAIVSSDLKRSFDTASIIAEPHGKEVITTPLLRERLGWFYRKVYSRPQGRAMARRYRIS